MVGCLWLGRDSGSVTEKISAIKLLHTRKGTELAKEAYGVGLPGHGEPKNDRSIVQR